MKVLIENFEPIGKLKLDLPPGTINVIVGSNGQGKSSVARALDAFVRNRTGNEYIRAGASQAKVFVKRNDGLVIGWKRDSRSHYEIGGKKEVKFGRQSLPEIYPDSGFCIEKEASGVIVPNIVPEKTKIFPFNLTPATTFRIFNRFLGVPKLEEMLKDQKTESKEARKKLIAADAKVDTYDKEVQLLEVEKDNLPDLDKLRELRDGIVELNKEKMKLENTFSNLSARIENFLVSKNQMTEVQKEFDILNEYIAEDIYDEAVKLHNLKDQVHARSTECEITEMDLEAMKLKVSIDLDPIPELIYEYNNLSMISGMYENYMTNKKYLFGYKETMSKVEKGLSKFHICPACGRAF